ncbi:hypothetical protein HJC23_013303 [Cyclotella cryptica]|uniref:Uncharacterized protein n=1 Tax=Cyclotella cryptica TaxID=29204 RepID=A0ABD3Q261_9STRA|eukprot:CCRYP_009706-RA/>CCRYP_009706-RA protein AED:0.11 eAED:0.11 QI:0/-1/0/1/-1/1/1/0/212
MWKPGASKPNAIEQQQRQGVCTTLKPTSSKQPAKKLSSATMGMRFMQRKSLDSGTTSPSPSRGLNGENAKKRTNENDNHLKNSTESNSNTIGPECDRIYSDNDRKRDIDTMTTSSAKDNQTIILKIATVVDMYGQGSDIIGRRSFGGFHKSVRATWDEAVQKRTSEDARRRHTKEHISDEELLKRYEKYVKKGRDRAGLGDSGRKDKKKRKS